MKLNRREFLRLAGMTSAAAAIQACSPTPGPPVIPDLEKTGPPEKNTAMPTARPTTTPSSEGPIVVATEAKSGNSELTQEEKDRAWEAFGVSYESFKRLAIVDMGQNEAAVLKFGENGNIVSEGMGYAMLMSSYIGDQTTFNKLRQYVLNHSNKWRLMSREQDKSGKIMDSGSATDADIDIATALGVNALTGKSDITGARVMIDSILKSDVEAGTNILKPGQWGGSSDGKADNRIVNPSYFGFANFRFFAAIMGDNRWNDVAEKQWQIIKAIHENIGGAETGLVPNWATYDGKAVEWKGNEGLLYGYDAARGPGRMAEAVISYDDPRARAELVKVNALCQRIGPTNLKTNMDLNGNGGKNPDAVAISTAANATIVATDRNYREAVFAEMQNAWEDNYFNLAIKTLVFLRLSGRYDLGKIIV